MARRRLCVQVEEGKRLPYGQDKTKMGASRDLRLKNPRHILYLIDAYHGKAAGGEGALLKLTRLLPPNRYQCSVGVFASTLTEPELASQFDCPVHLLPLRRTYDWEAARIAVRLRNIIRSKQTAIVHTFFTTADLWGGFVAKCSGVPILVSSRRDMGILRTSKHRIGYRLLRGIYDQVQAVCEEVRAFSIREDGLDPARVLTVHNGVDLEEIDSAPKLDRAKEFPELTPDSPIIASVGNVRRIKGTVNLVRAITPICREFPSTAILIVGRTQEEDYFAEVQKAIEELGVKENVKFLGSRGDVASILKMCDAFCLQSLSEGHSNALLEAMACELPCVATQVGGNGEMITEGEDGYLVPRDRPELAGQRLLALLRNREKAKEMGRRARETVEAKFQIHMTVHRIVESYDKLLGAEALGGI
jgi:L-malate glycosyltransferase